MNEYDGPAARQSYIGRARKVPAMKPKAIAHCMQQSPDDDLRAGVRLPDRPHNPRAARGSHAAHLSHANGPATRCATIWRHAPAGTLIMFPDSNRARSPGRASAVGNEGTPYATHRGGICLILKRNISKSASGSFSIKFSSRIESDLAERNHLKFKSFTARVRQSNLTGEVGARRSASPCRPRLEGDHLAFRTLAIGTPRLHQLAPFF